MLALAFSSFLRSVLAAVLLLVSSFENPPGVWYITRYIHLRWRVCFGGAADGAVAANGPLFLSSSLRRWYQASYRCSFTLLLYPADIREKREGEEGRGGREDGGEREEVLCCTKDRDTAVRYTDAVLLYHTRVLYSSTVKSHDTAHPSNRAGVMLWSVPSHKLV